jgi:hypothetical protein
VAYTRIEVRVKVLKKKVFSLRVLALEDIMDVIQSGVFA